MDEKMSPELRSELRKLANELWEQELVSELGKIREAFASFDRGEISPVEVSERLHEFADGTYRKLVEMNQTHEPALLLGRAVVKGFLTDDRIPEGAKDLVKRAVLFYRNKTTIFDRSILPPKDQEESSP